MNKRRTRKEKKKARLQMKQPAVTETKPKTEYQLDTSLIIKDLLKTGLITMGLLIVLGMLIIFLKP